MRKSHNVRQADITFASLYRTYIRPVKTAPLGEFLLGNSFALAQAPDGFAEFFDRCIFFHKQDFARSEHFKSTDYEWHSRRAEHAISRRTDA